MGSNALKSIFIIVITFFQFGYSHSQQVSRIYFLHLGEKNSDYRLCPQLCVIGDTITPLDQNDFKAPLMFEISSEESNQIFVCLVEVGVKNNIPDSIINPDEINLKNGSIFPVYVIARSKNDIELSHIYVKDKEEYLLLLEAFEDSVANTKIQDFIKYEKKLIE